MLTQENSIFNDPRITKLKKKREQLQAHQQIRNDDFQKNHTLQQAKIEKELEILISDQSHISQRNAKLALIYQGMRQQTIKKIAEIQAESNKLTHAKQTIYDYIIRHKAKETDLFLALTKTQQKPIKEIIEENQTEGLYMKEKEREIEKLKIENKILQDQLVRAENEQEYEREFQNNPHIAQQLIRKMAVNQPRQDDSSLSYETRQIRDAYVTKNNQSLLKQQNQYDQLDFSEV